MCKFLAKKSGWKGGDTHGEVEKNSGKWRSGLSRAYPTMAHIYKWSSVSPYSDYIKPLSVWGFVQRQSIWVTFLSQVSHLNQLVGSWPLERNSVMHVSVITMENQIGLRSDTQPQNSWTCLTFWSSYGGYNSEDCITLKHSILKPPLKLRA